MPKRPLNIRSSGVLEEIRYAQNYALQTGVKHERLVRYQSRGHPDLC